MVDGQPAADTGTCRRAIHLAVGEDTHIAAVAPGVRWLADEDDAIEKTKVLFRWVLDGV